MKFAACQRKRSGSTSPGIRETPTRFLQVFHYCLLAACLIAICSLLIVGGSSLTLTSAARNAEMGGTEATRTGHLNGFSWETFKPLQNPSLDYSRFIHRSQRHASIACTSCHARSDNSATPRFPGHKACTDCHLSQFTTPAVPMCVICHTDVNSGNPPLRSFPANFKESFNVKFDHTQHMTGSAKPQNGCSGCHNRPLNRGVALSIPADLAAHAECYTCHTPFSKSGAGREIASCGVCHDKKAYSPASTNSRSFRYAFGHSKHGPGQRLQCSTCHNLTAGVAPNRQVSSPLPTEHFPLARGMN